MPTRPEFYRQDGQLDFDAIRQDYQSRCTPEELDVRDSRYNGNTFVAISATEAEKKEAKKATDAFRIPIDTRVRVAAGYTDGKTCAELGEEFDISPITARRIVTAAGVYNPMRDRGRSSKKK